MEKYTKEMKSFWNRGWKLDVRSWTLEIVSCTLLLAACSPKSEKLPIFGEREFNGKDTVYHTIAPFQFVDQDSTAITNSTFKDKIYVADFFFTSCRTICPIMKTQMLRVYEVTTDVKDSIFKIAQTSYFATALEDKTEPDGYIHSGAFLLIDKQGRIRGKYDGTKEEDVNRLIADIKKLRNE